VAKFAAVPVIILIGPITGIGFNQMFNSGLDPEKFITDPQYCP
jgi:hypothetical protein